MPTKAPPSGFPSRQSLQAETLGLRPPKGKISLAFNAAQCKFAHLCRQFSAFMYCQKLLGSLLACFLLALSSFLLAQQPGPRLLSPPIFGAQTPTSLKVWTLAADAGVIELHYLDQVLTYSCEGTTCWKGNTPATFEVKGLGQDSVQAQFYLDGKPSGSPFWLKTATSKPKPEWSFLMGSCALYGVGVSGLVKPGRYTEIFDEMTAIDSDFMLWLGDNVYLLNGEYNDSDRMYEKYTKVRLEPHTNAFLASRPQYAILDDHDFGPDLSLIHI